MTEEKDTCGQCMKYVYYKNPDDGKGYCTADIPAWVRHHIPLEEFEYANEIKSTCTIADVCDLFTPNTEEIIKRHKQKVEEYKRICELDND